MEQSGGRASPIAPVAAGGGHDTAAGVDCGVVPAAAAAAAAGWCYGLYLGHCPVRALLLLLSLPLLSIAVDVEHRQQLQQQGPPP